MKSSANEIKAGTKLKTQICIVGAGAAGITLAKSLNQQNVEVLLLEAGGYEHSDHSQDLYKGEAESVPTGIFTNDYPFNSRLRFFGGATNHWGGWTRPFDEIDFQKRDWVPLSGWPIQRSELHSYYEGAARLTEITPFEFTKEQISPSDPKDQIKSIFFPNFDSQKIVEFKHFHYSPPTRFGEKYREELEGSKNIKILLNANALRFHLKSSSEDVIQRLSLINDKGDQFEVQADQFILACGGLENPRFLLNSNKEFEKGIGNSEDQVGRYFCEHPHVNLGVLLNVKGKEWLKSFIDLGVDEPKRILVTSNKFQREFKTLNYSCEVSSLSKLKNSFEEAHQVLRAVKTPMESTLFANFYVRGEMELRAENRVLLSDTLDRHNLKKIKLFIKFGENDLRSLRQSTQAVIRFFSAMGFGRGRIQVSSENSWSTELHYGHHHMCTTRMSVNPKEGVVDRNCKVHGIKNLFIAGSSVFPTPGFANPTLTLVALALRLSDHLKKEIKP